MHLDGGMWLNSRDGGDSRWRDDLDIVHQSHRVASEHLDNIKVKISINIKISIKTNIHIESSSTSLVP